MSEIVKMRDVRFEPGLFVNYRSGTVLDNLLCSYLNLTTTSCTQSLPHVVIN